MICVLIKFIKKNHTTCKIKNGQQIKKNQICCPWAALKKLVYSVLQVFGICASPIYQHRIQLEQWLMKKLTPDGARQKLIRISSLAPHTIKLLNVIFENI